MRKTSALLAGLTAGILLPCGLMADDTTSDTAQPPAASAPAAEMESPAEPATDQADDSSEAAEADQADDEETAGADEEAQPAMRYESPDAAAMALIEAAAADGADALYDVLGSDLEQLQSGDPVADAQDRKDFVELASQSADIEDETADSAILVLGPDDWPFPIPLARDATGWYFDTEEGIEEILDRRVGLNELQAIATSRAFVDAEREYAAADPDGDGVRNFADRVWSSEGKKDGLYWPTAAGEPESPMGPLVAEAVEEGYGEHEKGEGPQPYHGYYFKILSGQGPNTPGGAKSYVEDGRLTKGFALLAWPASYGNSGIMTFQVNQRGIVYQADFGEDTATTAPSIETYDLGEDWDVVVD